MVDGPGGLEIRGGQQPGTTGVKEARGEVSHMDRDVAGGGRRQFQMIEVVLTFTRMS